MPMGRRRSGSIIENCNRLYSTHAERSIAPAQFTLTTCTPLLSHRDEISEISCHLK